MTGDGGSRAPVFMLSAVWGWPHEVQQASPRRLQILRRTHRIHHRARTDRRRRAERLRQVEPCRSVALGDGGELLQEHARVRHGRRDLLGLRKPPGAQHCRSRALPRQCRAHRACRLQRQRRNPGDPPHRARTGVDLSHQRQGKRGPRTCSCSLPMPPPAPALPRWSGRGASAS